MSSSDNVSLGMDKVKDEIAEKDKDITPNGRPIDLHVGLRSRDVVDYRLPFPSEDEIDGPQQKSSSRNPFADRQNFVRQLCDASLLAANVSQLRVVLDEIRSSPEDIYIRSLLVMIILSILLHVGFGILMIQRWRKEREAEMEHKTNGRSAASTPTSNASVLTKQAKGTLCTCPPCLSVEKCDEISMYVMLFIVVLNVGIAGLGLSGPTKVKAAHYTTVHTPYNTTS